MADDTDVLLQFWKEQWAQARQTENQRSTMANLLIPIFTAGIGFVVVADFAVETLPVAVFLALLGAFGGIFSSKLFERWRLHERRAIKWSEQIDRLHPDARLLELFWEAHREHKAQHRRLRALGLYRLWGLFYLILTGLAVALVLFIILGGSSP